MLTEGLEPASPFHCARVDYPYPKVLSIYPSTHHMEVDVYRMPVFGIEPKGGVATWLEIVAL